MAFFQNKFCNPKLIKSELDAFVMEQDKGTRIIASAIAQHLIQTEQNDSGNTDNVLLIGPTGCGKTETFRRLQRLETQFCIPVGLYNVMDYSGSKSWIGNNCITSIFEDVFLHAGDIYYAEHDDSEPVDIQKREITKIANRAIIFLDEFDKICLQGDGRARNFLHDYQSNLLKIIEGNTYTLNGFSHDRINEKGEEETIDIDDVTVDTTHMLFVLLGAFSGIECITLQRLETERQRKELRNTPRHILYQDTSLGFLIEPRHHDDDPKKITYTYEQMIPSTDDIVQYGFLRELVGRLPIRAVYRPLSPKALVHIMLSARTSAYREYQSRFRQIGMELRCDRAGLREIARIATERGTGARGLITVFAELLSDAWYDLAGDNRHVRVLLRGKEIKAGKPPLLHDRTALVHKKWLLKRQQYFKKVEEKRKERETKKKAESNNDSAF